MIPLKDENPSRTFPFFTITLIVANILIYIYQTSLGSSDTELFVMQMAAVPYEIVHMTDIHQKSAVPIPLTILTAMFIHGGLLHLGGNMLYLWIFGNNIEDALGHFKFIIFYSLCGILATALHITSAPDSTTPLIGASGAIAGILGAYLLLYPRAKVHTLFIFIVIIKIIRIPAFVVLTLWFLIQVANSSSLEAGVAWYAHIGGFVAGVLLIKPFRRKKKPGR